MIRAYSYPRLFLLWEPQKNCQSIGLLLIDIIKIQINIFDIRSTWRRRISYKSTRSTSWPKSGTTLLQFTTYSTVAPKLSITLSSTCSTSPQPTTFSKSLAEPANYCLLRFKSKIKHVPTSLQIFARIWSKAERKESWNKLWIWELGRILMDGWKDTTWNSE